MPKENGEPRYPNKLKMERTDFKKKLKRTIEDIEDGLPPADALILSFGIADISTYRNWIKWAKEDIEQGFTEKDSRLIELILEIAKADAKLHKKLAHTAVRLAVEDYDSKMLQFLLKTRYGYTEKTKSKVELSNDEEAPVKFVFTDMTPNEE